MMTASVASAVATANVLTREEARALTDRIRQAAERLWLLLLEAYDRQAWHALGYSSWRAYATAELNIGQSHAYRLLDQGRVIRALEQAAGSPIGEIVSEHTARQIKPHLQLVTGDVAERVAAGETPSAAVAGAIRRVSERQPSYLRSRKRVDRPNRFVESMALDLEVMWNDDDYAAIDFAALDQTRVVYWATTLRRAARRINQFARRLEQITDGVLSEGR